MYCRLPGLAAPGWQAACRAMNERAPGPWLLTTDAVVWQAGSPVSARASPGVRLVSRPHCRRRQRCLGRVLSRAAGKAGSFLCLWQGSGAAGQHSCGPALGITGWPDGQMAGSCQLARGFLRRMWFAVCRRDSMKIDSTASRRLHSTARPPCPWAMALADGSFAPQTWIIVVKLNNRACESDH